MKFFRGNIFKKITIFQILALVLLIILVKQSFNLRNIGYSAVPDTFVILDERTNVWHGLSLRSTGVPSAWSNLGAYKKDGKGGDVDGFNIRVGEHYPSILNFINFPKPNAILYPIDLGGGKGIKHVQFVQPYFDHPPFGGLILSTLVSSNVKTFTDLTPYESRKTSLWLGVFTQILIFIFGWQVFKNIWIGLLASFIYGTAPSFVLLSRYALLENVFNPLMLVMINLLLLVQRFIKQQSSNNQSSKINITLIFAGIAAGFLALTKITGWPLVFMCIFLLRLWKFNRRQIYYFAIPAITLGFLYFFWGIFLDAEVFINVFRYQSLERGFIGSVNFLVTILRVGILNFPLDGWWIGGFLSLIFIPLKKEYWLISIGSITVLLTALLLGGANYPWYFIPLIPFMCVATAYFIWKMIIDPSPFSIIIFFLIFFSSSFYWGYGVYQADLESTNYQQPYELYRLVLLTFCGFGASLLIFEKLKFLKKLWFIFMIMIIFILFILNERSIYFIGLHWGKFPSLYTPGTF